MISRKFPIFGLIHIANHMGEGGGGGGPGSGQIGTSYTKLMKQVHGSRIQIRLLFLSSYIRLCEVVKTYKLVWTIERLQAVFILVGHHAKFQALVIHISLVAKAIQKPSNVKLLTIKLWRLVISELLTRSTHLSQTQPEVFP